MEHRLTGDVRVKSIGSLSSISIAGNTAIVFGKVTVIGMIGNEQSRMIVVDNGEPGSPDQLGLRLTDGSGDIPSLTFDPITLNGGNIQVPKP